MAVMMANTGWTIYAKRRGTPKKEFVTLGVTSAVMSTRYRGPDLALSLEVAYSPEFFGLIPPAHKAGDEIQIGFENSDARLLFAGHVAYASSVPTFRQGEPVKTAFILRLSEAPARFKRRKRK